MVHDDVARLSVEIGEGWIAFQRLRQRLQCRLVWSAASSATLHFVCWKQAVSCDEIGGVEEAPPFVRAFHIAHGPVRSCHFVNRYPADSHLLALQQEVRLVGIKQVIEKVSGEQMLTLSWWNGVCIREFGSFKNIWSQ